MDEHTIGEQWLKIAIQIINNVLQKVADGHIILHNKRECIYVLIESDQFIVPSIIEWLKENGIRLYQTDSLLYEYEAFAYVNELCIGKVSIESVLNLSLLQHEQSDNAETTSYINVINNSITSALANGHFHMTSFPNETLLDDTGFRIVYNKYFDLTDVDLLKKILNIKSQCQIKSAKSYI